MLPECYEKGTCFVQENDDKKKGFSSHLTVSCEWGYEKATYTSKNIVQETSERGMRPFEVNFGAVYAMRTVGLDHTDLEKIRCMLNIPKQMTVKNYNYSSDILCNAAKFVAERSMKDATSQLKKSRNVDILDIGVSVDGTWQKQGFSLLNGGVAVISIDNGKVIDVEPMSRYCRECFVNTRRLRDGDDSLQIWREKHRDVCKLNYVGSAPPMEPEGARRIFTRSIQTCKILLDADSKQ